MKRRNHLKAIAAIMGISSGCIESTNTHNLNKETAMEQFTDVTEFESPDQDTVEDAARFTDEEAGVVFWAFRHQASSVGGSSQVEIESLPIEQTKLGNNQSEN